MEDGNRTEAFDAFFYSTYRSDLKGFSAWQARRHYRRHGRREARPATPSDMLRRLQAELGGLPSDFSADGYVSLNGDLRHQLLHPWQAAEHYLKHGRHHGRRYGASPPARLTDRSSTDLLRARLVQAFGDTAAPDALVLEVHKAVVAADRSTTLPAALMDPVLLARWIMTASLEDMPDTASLEGQLKILFKTLFAPRHEGAGSALEMDIVDRLRDVTVKTEVFDSGKGRPAVTLLKLATEAACHRPIPQAPSSEETAALVARFFAQTVPQLGLERFITPSQRAKLRAPVTSDDATPLAALLLQETAETPPRPGLGRPAPAFMAKEVWLNNMAYVLSSEQLQADQVQVVAEGDRIQLYAPSFLVEDQLSISYEGSWAAREAAQSWLHRFVWSERQDLSLPQITIAASASAHASGAISLKGKMTPTTGGGRGGRKLLRVGDELTFGAEGPGLRHLIGRGWHAPEPTHVWSAAHTALIAINLDEDDVGPLDLFMRLSPGPRRQNSQVSVWWNGYLATTLWPTRDRRFTLHCHLGSRHRCGPTPNILCLGVDDTYHADGDQRSLGIALFELMLAHR